MTEKTLNFPEGKAIAEILKSRNEKNIGLRELLLGGMIGGFIELCQTGFKLVANSMQLWTWIGKSIVGFGMGFSATMIGAGYIMGFAAGFSILIGAMIAWVFCAPFLSHGAIALHGQSAVKAVGQLYASKIRYVGIGAMLVSGIWTLLTLLKPFYQSLSDSWKLFKQRNTISHPVYLRTEHDMPMIIVVLGVVASLIGSYFLFRQIFPLSTFNLTISHVFIFMTLSLLYLLVIGFIFSVITSYFSGLVGVSASPGSSVVIAGLLIAAAMTGMLVTNYADAIQLQNAAAIAIMIGGIATGIACIANDNIQDLKVGYLLGATPWKQQLMLLLGAVVAAAVIPWVMELLFNVYGIAGVLPHPGMNPTESLPAPPAALMAAITQGVFQGQLPWNMIFIGGVIAVIVILCRYLFNLRKLYILAVAIGIYLPLSTSVPLFMGGLFADLIQRKMKSDVTIANDGQTWKQKNILIACGLIAGSALMDVVLAIPFALARNPDILTIQISGWDIPSQILGLLVIVLLGVWFLRSK